MNIMVTGASGFIGSALCSKLSSGNEVTGVDIANRSFDNEKINWDQADLTDFNSVATICKKYSPNVVIHCAGIAHQKIGTVYFATYMRVNSEATDCAERMRSYIAHFSSRFTRRQCGGSEIRCYFEGPS